MSACSAALGVIVPGRLVDRQRPDGRRLHSRDDRAPRGLRMRFAIMEEVQQCFLDAAQVRDPAPRFLQPGGGDTADASSVGPVLELEQRGYFFQAESQGLRPLDEADPVYVAAAIAPIGAQAAARLGHQLAPLVVAHGLDPDARGVGHVPDREIRFVHFAPLDSVPKYGLYTAHSSGSMTWRM